MNTTISDWKKVFEASESIECNDWFEDDFEIEDCGGEISEEEKDLCRFFEMEFSY